MNTMSASTVTPENLLLWKINKPFTINYKNRTWKVTRLGHTFFELEHLGTQYLNLTAFAVRKKLENGPEYVDHEVLWGGPLCYRG